MRLRRSHDIAVGQDSSDRMRRAAIRVPQAARQTVLAGASRSGARCNPIFGSDSCRQRVAGPRRVRRRCLRSPAPFHGGYAVALPCTSATSRTFSTSPARLAQSRALHARWLSSTSIRSHMLLTARQRPSPHQSASSARRASSKQSWHRTTRSCGSAPSAA